MTMREKLNEFKRPSIIRPQVDSESLSENLPLRCLLAVKVCSVPVEPLQIARPLFWCAYRTAPAPPIPKFARYCSTGSFAASAGVCNSSVQPESTLAPGTAGGTHRGPKTGL